MWEGKVPFRCILKSFSKFCWYFAFWRSHSSCTLADTRTRRLKVSAMLCGKFFLYTYIFAYILITGAVVRWKYFMEAGSWWQTVRFPPSRTHGLRGSLYTFSGVLHAIPTSSLENWPFPCGKGNLKSLKFYNTVPSALESKQQWTGQRAHTQQSFPSPVCSLPLVSLCMPRVSLSWLPGQISFYSLFLFVMSRIYPTVKEAVLHFQIL